jgi:hypothetical protein
LYFKKVCLTCPRWRLTRGIPPRKPVSRTNCLAPVARFPLARE